VPGGSATSPPIGLERSADRYWPILAILLHLVILPSKYAAISPRREKQTARSMKGETYDYIGKIIDYQTPLKDVQADVAGKIDLLAWNEEKDRAYILEFKMLESKETLLRCVLDAYTYWRIVDYIKLLRDFNSPAGTPLRKAVLVHQGSLPHNSFSDPNVAQLMHKLGVDLSKDEFCSVQ
jgi:hypothetical protein